MSERFVDKLGSGNVEPLDSCQRGCSLDEHSEDIASLDLQISEITSFVKTTQLLQRLGGDFYWMQQQEDWTALVVADCTGHGIPGAFMTLISTTILDRIASLHDLSHPDHILDQLDELMSQTFKLNTGDSTSFGLDCGVCCFSREEGILRFAGAKSNLYQKMGEDVREMRGDRVSLGYDSKQHPIPFNVVETSLDEESSFYLFSDGITDQIGGEKKLMYGKKRLLRQIQSSVSVAETIEGIMKDLSSYQADNKRRDDLTLFGFSF